MIAYKCDRCKCDLGFPSGEVNITYGNRCSFHLCWDCAQKLIEFIERGPDDDTGGDEPC